MAVDGVGRDGRLSAFSLDDAETFGTRGFVHDASFPPTADFIASSPVSQRARPVPGIGALAARGTFGIGVGPFGAGSGVALDVVATGIGAAGWEAIVSSFFLQLARARPVTSNTATVFLM